MDKRTALITGATSGIGEATARILAQNSFDLILCGRRKDRLESLRSELAKLTDVHTLSFDVRDRQATEKALSSLEGKWKNVDVLINNAGNAHGLDPVQSGNVDDWDAMMDINVKGLLYVSRAILPGMAERKRGHVINIGSIAGQEVYPKGAVYCASKFAVDAITKGMRLDLNEAGIKVTIVSPGMVETEFSLVRFKGDADRAKSVYAGLKPLTADDIAEVIRYILHLPDHVVLTDVTILPRAQASATVVHREG
ncbi:MAG TPA: SDR family NAD(P)-dependent oxidoreductase [Cyclobacteriaceae bacterium]|jgi:NADP-dependent 3-hydroxy acid dehydrogenase YdfG|nr:SDR family NAD(P)-dependent oxidoreductase [Cyclobacteriaceae bacterium]